MRLPQRDPAVVHGDFFVDGYRKPVRLQKVYTIFQQQPVRKNAPGQRRGADARPDAEKRTDFLHQPCGRPVEP